MRSLVSSISRYGCHWTSFQAGSAESFDSLSVRRVRFNINLNLHIRRSRMWPKFHQVITRYPKVPPLDRGGRVKRRPWGLARLRVRKKSLELELQRHRLRH